MSFDNLFQGSRLYLARTFNGLTLAELGERVSASRQYIQKLETGDQSPSDDLLLALAETLHVQPSFFFQPLTREVREEQGHFRKLQTTPQNIRRRVLAYGTMFHMLVEFLDTELSLPEIDIPSFPVTKTEEIEKAAESCRDHWGLLSDAPITNMTRVLERAGVVVTTFQGVSDKVDAFSLVSGRPIIVRSLDKDSTSRARFDLAHECGHLVMHEGIETGDPETEAEANRFASAFLLPRTAFVREFPRSSYINWMGIFDLKKRWGVSLQAIIRRAYDLGMITAVQYRNANVYISRKGWKKGEPGEPNPEFPEIIPTSIRLLKESGAISLRGIAANLQFSPQVLSEFGIDVASEMDESHKIISLKERRFRSLKGKSQ